MQSFQNFCAELGTSPYLNQWFCISPPSAAYASVNWVSIISGNDLSPVRRQAITWNNADLLSIGPLGTNFGEIWIKIRSFQFMKMHMKMSSAKMAAILSRGDICRKLLPHKQRVLMHGHQGWNVRHGLCHIYMRYVYIYIYVVYSFCLFCCLFIVVTWWYVWCIEWASGNQEEVQACLVTLCLFIISCYSLYKTTLGLLCSWFENNPYFHKYSTDFHV